MSKEKKKKEKKEVKIKRELDGIVSKEVEEEVKKDYFPYLYKYEKGEITEVGKDNGFGLHLKQGMMYEGLRKFLTESDYEKCYASVGRFTMNGFSVFKINKANTLRGLSEEPEVSTFLFKDLVDIYTEFGWNNVQDKILELLYNARYKEEAFKVKLRQFEAVLLRHSLLDYLYKKTQDNSVCNKLLTELYKDASFNYVEAKKEIIQVLKKRELSQYKYKDSEEKIIPFDSSSSKEK